MTLHEKAQKRALKGAVITTELLNERNNDGETVWHHAARVNSLRDIPIHFFTEEAMNKVVAGGTANDGDTVWHVAAKNYSLEHIPKHLFTEEAMKEKNEKGETVWESAVKNKTLRAIPKHLFTEEVFNEEDGMQNTLWHHAAGTRTLKDIPRRLFSAESLKRKNDAGYSALHYAAVHDTLRAIPKHLFTQNLIEGVSFNKAQYEYINTTIETNNKLLEFMGKSSEKLAKEIEFRDERYILDKVDEENVYFQIQGIHVIVNKEGVFLNNENHKTLSDAITFIEKTYPDIEQILHLPVNNTVPVGSFIL